MAIQGPSRWVIVQHALIAGHQRRTLACRSILSYSAVCFVPSHCTHTPTHMLLMDCSLTLSPPLLLLPSPNPSIAYSGNSASGRVAFILYIVSLLNICPIPLPLQLFTGRARINAKCQISEEQNQPLPSTDVPAAVTRHQAAFLCCLFLTKYG